MSQEDSIGRTIIIHPARPRIQLIQCFDIDRFTVLNRVTHEACDCVGTFNSETRKICCVFARQIDANPIEIQPTTAQPYQ